MIGIVAPSGPLRDGDLEDIKKCIESYGQKVKFSRSCYLNHKGYLAGDDFTRCRDLEAMFLDDEVDVVMCLRGGYGAMRILDMINYDIIRLNPKIFIGFSDITALHLAFYKKCGLKTFHGIMGASSPRWDKFSYKSLVDAINFKNELVLKNPKHQKIHKIFGGIAEGEIVGGNLALIVSTLGTEYEIDTKGKILFIEDIGEPLYKLDRMMTQLKMCKKLDDCNGIIFGDFKDCADEKDIYNLLKETLKDCKKPSIFNLKSGHCMPMLTIPLGERCVLDANEKNIKISRKI
jgi:muramoyltetrapeptide carboxypeptidase